MNATNRKALTAKRAAPVGVAVVLASPEPWKFPKRADFHFDFPKSPVVEPVEPCARYGNAAGVAASWSNAKVREARMTKHGVTVTFRGKTTEHRSVREAFRAFRLPDSQHIRFRLALKAAGRAAFPFADQMYMFTIVGWEEVSDAIRI